MSLIASVLLASAAAAAPSATPAAARAVVQRYYAAIDRRDYRSAYRSWSRGGQASGQSYQQFVRGFANTRHTSVVAGAVERLRQAERDNFVANQWPRIRGYIDLLGLDAADLLERSDA